MPSKYVVKPGDSLWTIAQKTGKDWLSVVAAYGGRDPNTIQPGETINLPSGRASEGSRSRAAVRAGVSATGRPGDVGAFSVSEQGGLIQSNFVPEVAAQRRAPDVINLAPHSAARAREDISPALRTTQYQQLSPGGRPLFPTVGRSTPSTAKAKAKAREAVSPLGPGVTYAERMAAYSRAFGAAASGAVGGIQTILSGAAGALPEPQEAITQAAINAVGSIGRTALQQYYGNVVPSVFESWPTQEQAAQQGPINRGARETPEAVTGVGYGRQGAPMFSQGPMAAGSPNYRPTIAVGGKNYYLYFNEAGQAGYSADARFKPGGNAVRADLGHFDSLVANGQKDTAMEIAQRRARFGQSGGLATQVFLVEQAIQGGRKPTYATENVFALIALRDGWAGTLEEYMYALGYIPDIVPGVWKLGTLTMAGGGGPIGGGSIFGSGGGGFGGRGGGGGATNRGGSGGNIMIDWRITA